VTIATCGELAAVVGTGRACRLTGRSRATHFRARLGAVSGPPAPRPTPANALSDDERAEVLAVLHSPAYVDLAVAQVWAMLLDGGTYIASQSTMHRVLRECGGHRDRRRQRTHPAKKKPHLVAHAPLHVWCWDITKLPGPVRGVSFDCYVIIDIFSRFVVGWTVAACEDSVIARDLIAGALARHGVERDQLTLHADRGTSMTSKTVVQLLEDLGVTRTHSRPHVSDDNPYIEAHFKTLKYCPAWPGHFDTLDDARAWCEAFFDYYNHVHRHRALGLHTPASVHYGTASEIRAQRAVTLLAAYAANPGRFAGPPTPPKLPTVAWINEPEETLIQNV
jgi:putative transposase